jgi:uncharacterized membrane protein
MKGGLQARSVDSRAGSGYISAGGYCMKLKIIERVLAVLLAVVWILLLVRAHAVNPIAFYQMQPILYVGDVAVLVVLVMSLVTGRPLLGEREVEEKDLPGPTIEE